MDFVSAVPHYPDCIDSRQLHMEAVFFQLSKQQVDELMLLVYYWCRQKLGAQCVTQWHFSGKRCAAEQIPQEISNNSVYDFAVEGYFCSEAVYDQKSMKRFDQRRDELFHKPEFTDISLDYLDFYEDVFSKPLQSVDQWKSALMKVFWVPNRICHSSVMANDVYLYAAMSPHRQNHDRYFGSIQFEILNICLNNNTTEFANAMVDFLNKLSGEFTNVNARISLSPPTLSTPCGGHMTYFGGNVPVDMSIVPQGFQSAEWEKACYLYGADWFNIISPTAQHHLPDLAAKASIFPTLHIRMLSSGGISIKVNKDISLLDVDDLLPPKKLLYNALYPGMQRIPKNAILPQTKLQLRWMPRAQWELVPVLEEEICITDSHVVFQHLCHLNFDQ